MLTTDDDDLAERARILRMNGVSRNAWNRYGPDGYKHWDIVEPGWKYNMSDIHAALGLAQLTEIDSWRGKRVMLSLAYSNYLPKDVQILKSIDEDIRPALHLFVVRVPERDRVMDEIQKRGIGVGVHFRAVHRLKFYQERYQIPAGELPVAEQASEEVLSLPLYPLMEVSDALRAAETLDKVLRHE